MSQAVKVKKESVKENTLRLILRRLHIQKME